MKPINTRKALTRIAMAGLLMLLFVIAVALAYYPLGAWIFVTLLAILVSLAQREYYNMALEKGVSALSTLGIVSSFAYLFALFALPWPASQMVLLVSLILLFIGCFSQRPEPLVSLAVTVFGIGYLAVTLGTILSITYFHFNDGVQDGRWWLVYLVAVTKVTDMVALAVGKLAGRTPLAPRISPKKTVEGAVGGFTAAVLVSLVFTGIATLFPHVVAMKISLAEAFALGTCIGLLSQVGDLSESVLKRDAGVKDSSHLPGLGGLLDVVDSLVFTSPFLFFFLEWSHK